MPNFVYVPLTALLPSTHW